LSVEITAGSTGPGGLFDAANDGDTIRVSTALLRAAVTYTQSTFQTVFSGNNSLGSVRGTATSNGIGVYGSSSTGNGGYFSSTSGAGLIGISTSNVGAVITTNPSSINTDADVMTIQRLTSGTASTNIGGAVRFNVENAAGTSALAGRVGFRWTDASANNESSFFIQTTDSLTTTERFRLNHLGQLTIPGYANAALNNVDSSLHVLTIDATGDVHSIPIDSLGGTGGSGDPDQTLSVSNDSLTISGTGNTVRVPATAYLRDSVTTTTLTLNFQGRSNALYVVKMESAGTVEFTLSNPWGFSAGSYPNLTGEVGVYTIRLVGVSGTDAVTWNNVFHWDGTAFGTDNYTEDTKVTLYYDPVEAKYYGE
jgi:hypothetical protein